MKTLIKLTTLVFLLSLGTQAFAQTYGVKAGLNLSNMVFSDDDGTYSDDFEMNPGFNVGVTAEFPISGMISFETGLLLASKGYKTSMEVLGSTIEQKMNLLYVNIPLTAKATYDLGSAKIYGAFGPYVGVGLSGKIKIEASGESEDLDIEWGSDESEDDLKRLDYGLTFGAGVEINSFLVGINYDLGLANVSSYTEYGTKITNRVLGISVGYKFGGE